MHALIQIFTHTPPWVFILFLYGVSRGIRGLRVREISLWRMIILPLIFVGLSLSSLANSSSNIFTGFIIWGTAVLSGYTIGSTILSYKIENPSIGPWKARIGGSTATLILFLIIFITKYCYNVTLAVNPSMSDNFPFITTIHVISGISTGIMFGRVTKLFRRHIHSNSLKEYARK